MPLTLRLGTYPAETNVPIVPIVPCYLSGTMAALHADHRWPRPDKISLDIGAPLNFADVGNDRRGWQTVAERLQEGTIARAGHSSRRHESLGFSLAMLPVVGYSSTSLPRILFPIGLPPYPASLTCSTE